MRWLWRHWLCPLHHSLTLVPGYPSPLQMLGEPPPSAPRYRNLSGLLPFFGAMFVVTRPAMRWQRFARSQHWRRMTAYKCRKISGSRLRRRGPRHRYRISIEGVLGSVSFSGFRGLNIVSTKATVAHRRSRPAALYCVLIRIQSRVSTLWISLGQNEVGWTDDCGRGPAAILAESPFCSETQTGALPWPRHSPEPS